MDWIETEDYGSLNLRFVRQLVVKVNRDLTAKIVAKLSDGSQCRVAQYDTHERAYEAKIEMLHRSFPMENQKLVELCRSLLIRMEETGDLDIASQAVINSELPDYLKRMLQRRD